jgi:hypothetical protein
MNDHLLRKQQLHRLLSPDTSERGRLLMDDAYPASLIDDLYGKLDTNDFLQRFAWATYDTEVDGQSFSRLKKALARFNKADNQYLFYASSLQLVNDAERSRFLNWSESIMLGRAAKIKNMQSFVNYLIMYLEQGFNVENFPVTEDKELTLKINEVVEALADIFAQSQSSHDRMRFPATAR